MHDNDKEDRRWGFECTPLSNFAFDSCSWTGLTILFYWYISAWWYFWPKFLEWIIDLIWQKTVLVVCRYVNNFDETFVYECTTGAGVITGADMKKSQEGKLSQVRKKRLLALQEKIKWLNLTNIRIQLQVWRASMTMEKRTDVGATSAVLPRYIHSISSFTT